MRVLLRVVEHRLKTIIAESQLIHDKGIHAAGQTWAGVYRLAFIVRRSGLRFCPSIVTMDRFRSATLVRPRDSPPQLRRRSHYAADASPA
jgi:hypothetical protein